MRHFLVPAAARLRHSDVRLLDYSEHTLQQILAQYPPARRREALVNLTSVLALPSSSSFFRIDLRDQAGAGSAASFATVQQASSALGSA